ncbi:unnamed protein product, partial [Rotaria sordida]
VHVIPYTNSDPLNILSTSLSHKSEPVI